MLSTSKPQKSRALPRSKKALERKWTEKDVDFDVDLDSVDFTGYEGLLQHVWTNLIDNAVKFGPRGGLIRMRLIEEDGSVLVTAQRDGMDANALRKLGDFLRDKNPNTVAALGSVNGEKVTLLAVCGKNAIARGIKAGDIIRNIAPIVGGKGGGKPDSAMGGGTNALKLDDALAAVDDFVSANVKE